jgi:hypothetical protein
MSDQVKGGKTVGLQFVRELVAGLTLPGAHQPPDSPGPFNPPARDRTLKR